MFRLTIQRLRAFGFLFIGFTALASDTPCLAQRISLKTVMTPRVVALPEPDVSSAMLTSCGTSLNLPTQPSPLDPVVYASMFNGPRSMNSELAHPFLLQPPFACTPEADRLFSRSVSDLTSISFEEFLAITKLPKPNRALRTGTFEARQEFDRREAALPGKVAAVQKLLADRKPEEAHDALDAAFPGKRREVVMGLARLLLLADEPDLQRYGRSCLERSADSADKEQFLDADALFGHLALKEHRWADATLHYQNAATRILSQASTLTVQEETERLKPIRFCQLVLAEQQGNYNLALFEIDTLLALDPKEPLALLHKGVVLFLKADGGPRRSQKVLEVQAVLEDAYNRFHEKHQEDRHAPMPPPKVMLLGLYSHVGPWSEKPDYKELWSEVIAEVAELKTPEEKRNVYFTAALWHTEQGMLDDAKHYLDEAEQVDSHSAQSPLRSEILFYMRDEQAVEELGRRFLADPADEKSAGMYVLALLDSTEPAHRARGSKLAAVLHRAHPKSVTLAAAAGYADFLAGRHDDAIAKIQPILDDSDSHVGADDAYLLARIMISSNGGRYVDKFGERSLVRYGDLLEQAILLLDNIQRSAPGPSRFRKQAETLLSGLRGMPQSNPLSQPEPVIRFDFSGTRPTSLNSRQSPRFDSSR
jgi:tetratricopeptide (TPR) repeat protein